MRGSSNASEQLFDGRKVIEKGEAVSHRQSSMLYMNNAIVTFPDLRKLATFMNGSSF